MALMYSEGSYRYPARRLIVNGEYLGDIQKVEQRTVEMDGSSVIKVELNPSPRRDRNMVDIMQRRIWDLEQQVTFLTLRQSQYSVVETCDLTVRRKFRLEE